MLCRPAVTTMNVKPRLAQTLLTATAHSAVSSSFSRPGTLGACRRSSRPAPRRWGCSRKNHISEATATLVATVDEKTVRKKAMPRRCLSTSTARPDAQRQADRHGHQREAERHPERLLELAAAEHVDVLIPTVAAAVAAGGVATLVPQPDRRDRAGRARTAPSTASDGASSTAARPRRRASGVWSRSGAFRRAAVRWSRRSGDGARQAAATSTSSSTDGARHRRPSSRTTTVRLADAAVDQRLVTQQLDQLDHHPHVAGPVPPDSVSSATCSGRTPTSRSPGSTRPAGRMFIGGVPMNWATNTDAGRA